MDMSENRSHKRLRKGTKSCVECRRRKVRCSFQERKTTTCDECRVRRSECREQENGDTPFYDYESDQSIHQLRDRLAYLEGLIHQRIGRGPASVDASYDQPQSPPNSGYGGSPVPQQDATRATVTKLKSRLPPRADIERILDTSLTWPVLWRLAFSSLATVDGLIIKESVWELLRSNDAIKVAKGILCLALSICYHQPKDCPQDQLIPISYNGLSDSLARSVDKLVLAEDDMAANIDGIECMIIRMKLHLVAGRARRAWLLCRRGIDMAQLLDLQRLPKGTVAKRHCLIWMNLIHGDLDLSLLLGAPRCVSDRLCETYMGYMESCAGIFDGEIFLSRMTKIVGRLVDCYQTQFDAPDAAILQIDQDLESLAQTKSREWWTLTSRDAAELTVEERYCRRSTHFYYHQVRTALHLPFCLKASVSEANDYSRRTALRSARETIRIYEAMTAEYNNSLPFCRLMDFRVFISAILVVLEGRKDAEISSERREQDRVLIETMIHILKNASGCGAEFGSNDCAKALELLAMGKQLEGGSGAPPSNIEITVPFFGKITVENLNGIMQSRENSNQDDTWPTSSEVRQAFESRATTVLPDFLPAEPGHNHLDRNTEETSLSYDAPNVEGDASSSHEKMVQARRLMFSFDNFMAPQPRENRVWFNHSFDKESIASANVWDNASALLDWQFIVDLDQSWENTKISFGDVS